MESPDIPISLKSSEIPGSARKLLDDPDKRKVARGSVAEEASHPSDTAYLLHGGTHTRSTHKRHRKVHTINQNES